MCKSEAAQLIQECADKKNIICLCEASENVGLIIYYFVKNQTTLNDIFTTEAAINDIIQKNFESNAISIPEGVNRSVVNEYFQKLQQSCLQKLNKNSIVMIQQANDLLLFGMIQSVKHVIAEHEKMKLTDDVAQIKLDYQDYKVCFKSEIV